MAKRNKSWKDQLHTLDQRRDAISEIVADYETKDTVAVLREMQELRSEDDQLGLQKQRISERIEAIGQVIADRWDKEGIASLNVEGLGTFSIHTKLHVSAPDKETYHAWLRANNLDSLIQPQVAAKTTEALVRERLEDGLPCDGIGLAIHYKTIVR
jgi:hypothetical protein